MPKKFATENTKAVAARARKTTAKETDGARKQKEVDDAYWQDDDKRVAKKQQKKDDQEQKRQQQLTKKAEMKEILDKEMTELTTIKPKVTPVSNKVTRVQIEAGKAKAAALAAASSKPAEKKNVEVVEETPLQENMNRLSVEGEEARTVTEAIAILSDAQGGSGGGDADKHPEKRMKAAYTAYSERRLVELKSEEPSLRMSQLKQLIFKEWQKSPENPLNMI